MSARVRVRVALLVGAAFAAGACSLRDLGDLTDELGKPSSSDDGGSTSRDGAALLDAAPDVKDAAVQDVAADTFAAPSFCTTVDAAFCDDFDEAPLPSKFGAVDGTFLSLVPGGKSAPTALLLAAPPSSDTGSFTSKATKTLTTRTGARFILRFDILAEQLNPGSTQGLLFAVVEYTQGQAKYSLRLAFNQGAARVEESTLGTGGGDVIHPSFTIPGAQWTRLEVDANVLTQGALTPGVTIALDGTVIPVGRQALAGAAATIDLHPSVLIGAAFGGSPHNDWKIHYDNVVLVLP